MFGLLLTQKYKFSWEYLWTEKDDNIKYFNNWLHKEKELCPFPYLLYLNGPGEQHDKRQFYNFRVWQYYSRSNCFLQNA